jgi:hypothetical protein
MRRKESVIEREIVKDKARSQIKTSIRMRKYNRDGNSERK